MLVFPGGLGITRSLRSSGSSESSLSRLCSCFAVESYQRELKGRIKMEAAKIELKGRCFNLVYG